MSRPKNPSPRPEFRCSTDDEVAVLAVSGRKTKKAAVTLALEEFVARRQQAGAVDLFGTLDWDPCYDYKEERSRE